MGSSLISLLKEFHVQDKVKVMSIINLVLVKKNMLRYVQDVRAVRGMG